MGLPDNRHRMDSRGCIDSMLHLCQVDKGNVAMKKQHLIDDTNQTIPAKNRKHQTACGLFIKDNLTNDIKKATCMHCIKVREAGIPKWKVS